MRVLLNNLNTHKLSWFSWTGAVDAVCVVEAFSVRLDILLKMVLIPPGTLGGKAPAATAMKPARRAYSTRSCAASSGANVKTKLYSLFLLFFSENVNSLERK